MIGRLLLLFLVLVWTLATTLAAAPPAGTSQIRLESEQRDLPDAFGKPAPEGIEDLQAIERHIVQLIPRLRECTVALRIGRAQGTGVIVSADGLIATAAHVVGRPGRMVTVVMPDGKEYGAETLGRNRTLDASLLRIRSPRRDWPHCPLASDRPELGDWCLAIGHPGGLQEDRGPVVRLGRVIIANDYFVQTDCELVGGDSGGPLFDMQGRVMAVSSRIGEPTTFNFHVPAAAYTRDWERLLAGDDFRSHSGAFLGISAEPVEGGLKVTKIHEDSPAEESGLQVGDIIITFQNKQIANIDELSARVGEEMPGRMVRIEYLRGGKPHEMRLRLGMNWE